MKVAHRGSQHTLSTCVGIPWDSPDTPTRTARGISFHAPVRRDTTSSVTAEATVPYLLPSTPTATGHTQVEQSHNAASLDTYASKRWLNCTVALFSNRLRHPSCGDAKSSDCEATT